MHIIEIEARLFWPEYSVLIARQKGGGRGSALSERSLTKQPQARLDSAVERDG